MLVYYKTNEFQISIVFQSQSSVFINFFKAINGPAQPF